MKSGAEWIELRAYDCTSKTFMLPVSIKAGDINIIEGAYSCHPALWEYYDLHLFMDVSTDEQKRRIIDRNRTDGWKVFSARWIPLEETYFKAYQVKKRCDDCIHTTKSGAS